jgi:hypothetical protein
VSPRSCEDAHTPSRSSGGKGSALNQAAYDRAMGRLRVCVRVVSAVLLALLARTLTHGANLAVVVTEALITLLLLASTALWRHGRRLQPHTNASRTTTPTAEVASGSPSPVGTNRVERNERGPHTETELGRRDATATEVGSYSGRSGVQAPRGGTRRPTRTSM